MVGETVLTSDPVLENITFNASQNPSPNLEQELLTALTQNNETIQHNLATIDDVTQALNNHLAEVIHDDLEETILRRPYDEAILAIVEAGDDGDTGDAVDANDAVDDGDNDDAGSATNPPAYSPTRA